MDFSRTPEQQELASIIRAMLAKRADSMAIRKAIESEAGYDVGLWSALVEQIGVAALPVPDEFDGAGGSLVESAIALEEIGYALAPVPLLASAIAVAAELLGERSPAKLSALARGDVFPVSLGSVILEPDVPAKSMDLTMRLGSGGTPPPPNIVAIAAGLISAQQVGAMQRALDMTVQYSKERIQFGRPIGSFQALKHRMADMLVLTEAGRSASWAASYAAAAYVADPNSETQAAVRRISTLARQWCNEAGKQVASETIQLHGGIAITWEHDAHLVFKRIHALAHLI